MPKKPLTLVGGNVTTDRQGRTTTVSKENVRREFELSDEESRQSRERFKPKLQDRKSKDPDANPKLAPNQTIAPQEDLNQTIAPNQSIANPSDLGQEPNQTIAPNQSIADTSVQGENIPIRLGGGGEPEQDNSISAQIARLRDGTAGGALDNPIARILGDPITTEVLVTILGALTVYRASPAWTGAGKYIDDIIASPNIVRITRTIRKASSSGTFNAANRTITTQRGVPTLGGKAEAAINQMFKTLGGTAAKRAMNNGAAGNVGKYGGFGSNPKMFGLTVKALTIAGFSLGAVNLLTEFMGTYSWAGHNDREAGDTLLIAMGKALENGDIENYVKLRVLFDEQNNPDAWQNIKNNTPYVNVIESSERGREGHAAFIEILDDIAENLNKPSQFEIDRENQRELDEEQRIKDQEAFNANAQLNRDLKAEADEKRRQDNEEQRIKDQEAFNANRDEQREKDLALAIEKNDLFKKATQGQTKEQKSALSFGLIKSILPLLLSTVSKDS